MLRILKNLLTKEGVDDRIGKVLKKDKIIFKKLEKSLKKLLTKKNKNDKI